jgi:hypothetical protein
MQMTKFNFAVLAIAVPMLLGALAPASAAYVESDLYNVGGSDFVLGSKPVDVKKVGLNDAVPSLSAGEAVVVCIASEPGTWSGYDVWNAVTCSQVDFDDIH